MQESYQQYLLRGGFPFALQLPDDESFRDYIDGVVNTVLVKDVLARKDKSDSTLVRRLAAFLTDTAGSLTSPKKIAGTLTSMGEKTTPNTVASYLELLENAFLFYRCDRFDICRKKYLSINPKYYPVDISLRRALVGQKRPNKGSRLETIVYQELRRRGYEIYVGVMQQTEVDFVVVKDGRREYYQVSLSLDDEQIYQREVRSLRLIDDNYPKIILTEDPGHFDDQGISQVNIIDWLMGEGI
ncbi:ATP-binding protein [Lactobacillus delbrueckii]|uniref:ATP-binding protein n=1 Tax=Lactobacillus delbrueckii TaxID=1584 RepID=UPI001F3BE4FC|nr:ATP-binding protein [Lactobacillus delbrueckii]